MNHKVFFMEFQHYFGEESVSIPQEFVVEHQVPSEQSILSDRISPVHFKAFGNKRTVSKTQSFDMEEYLHQKINSYALVFNTYIPGKRIIIPAINVDAPIIDVPYATQEKLVEGDFDKELTRGVVKYPFTSDPGET